MCGCLRGLESKEYNLRPEKREADHRLWEVIRYYEEMGKFFHNALQQKIRLNEYIKQNYSR